MADPIRRFFDSHIGRDAIPIFTDRESEDRRRLQVAACALLLELAHADDEFSDAEGATVTTGSAKLYLQVSNFRKDEQGLVIGATRAQFEAAAAQIAAGS